MKRQFCRVLLVSAALLSWVACGTAVLEKNDAALTVTQPESGTTLTALNERQTEKKKTPVPCPSCLDAKGKCVGGVYDDSCGTGGVRCVKCAADMSCDRVSKKCIVRERCNPSTCAEGCCDEYGFCHRIQPDDSHCGSEARVCQDCHWITQHCCKSTSSCMPTGKCPL